MEEAVVVLDNGSGFIKAGLHTNAEPTCVVPQLVARPRQRRLTSNARETFVGRRALTMSGVSTLSAPSERGFIRSFDDQNLIFEDLFSNQLRLDPNHHPVLLSQLPRSSGHQERHLTEELFERFCVPALVKKPDSVLSLVDAGRLSGIVLDCGDTISHSSAVYYGEILLNTVRLLRLGGKDVSECLSRIVMRETGFYATTKSAMDHISRIKEGLQALKGGLFRRRRSFRRGASFHYALPDGQKIHIHAESLPELYKAGEILFEPDRLGIASEGLSDMLLATCANAPSSLRVSLTQNVVLCGGSALLSGLRERLEAEALDNLGVELNLYFPPKPQFSTWRGGAILAALSTFDAMSVTRQEYFDEGPQRIERKFS